MQIQNLEVLVVRIGRIGLENEVFEADGPLADGLLKVQLKHNIAKLVPDLQQVVGAVV